MNKFSIQTKPLEIYQQILELDPDIPMVDIADVVSEWGDLISDRQHKMREVNKVTEQDLDSQGQSISNVK